MFKDGTGKPTDAQGERLVSELSVVDNDVLSLAANNGTRIAVADRGDDMRELGLIVPQTPEEIKARMPGMRAAAGELHGAVDRLETAIENDTGVEQAGAGLKESMFKGLDAGVSLFESPAQKAMSAEGPNALMAAQIAAQLPKSVPLEALASSHGARTEAEVKEFTGMVRDLNKDKLAEWDQNARASLAADANGDDPFGKMRAQQTLANSEGKTMVNWNEEAIVVPDLYYHRSPGSDENSPALRLDRHDNDMTQMWGRGETKTLPFYSRENRDGVDVGGQYQRKTDSMILQNGVEHAGVHELGHRIEDLVEQKDPEFYKDWNQRVNQTYEQKKSDGGSVTPYSMEDPREYTAEGFSFYHEDPKLLKAKDPELFKLTEELVQRAGLLGRQ